MAHIIKPAVANLLAVFAYNSQEGASTTGAWTPRVINTIEGESWFVSLSGTGTTGVGGTNTDFTLEPGTYKLKGRFPFFLTGYTYMRLYDVTNSTAVSGANAQSNWYFKEDVGIENAGHIEINTYLNVTASTKYRYQYHDANNDGSWSLGPSSSTLSTQLSIGVTVQIEKLK